MTGPQRAVAWCKTRPLPWTVTVAAGLLLLLSGAQPTSAAQTGTCVQPSAAGCPIGISRPVAAAISSGDDVDLWTLVLTRSQPLHIVLSGLVGDYDLHVYAGDQTLVGESVFDDVRDHFVDIDNLDAGTYLIYINSPYRQTSPTPYTLVFNGPSSDEIGPNPPAGTVLLAENFEDPQHGWFPSGPVNRGFVRYLDGEYQIARTGVGSPGVTGVRVPGTYTDSSIAFDIRFVNPTPSVRLGIACRSTNGYYQYGAPVQPQLRLAGLNRLDGQNNAVPLVADTPQSVLQRDSPIHVELRCAGTTITLLLNGSVVASAQDATYASGTYFISIGESNDLSVDARISHLVVTQL